jgi:hypothetical protein
MLGRAGVPDQDRAAAAIVDDLYWDGPPTPTTIDYSWLIQPVQWRLDPPVNDVSVADGDNNAARVTSPASVAAFGTKPPATPVTLATATPADADALAEHTVFYYAVAPPGALQRQRCPQIAIDVLALTPDEQALVLSIDEGSRIVIANTPGTWPTGASTLVIEGKVQDIGVSRRRITFNTSPVIGTGPGAPGPYFRWGASVWETTTDLIPF